MAVKKAAAPKKAATVKETTAPAVSGGAVPFQGEECTYVDPQGKEHDAIVAIMHGGCVADLTILSTDGNTSADNVPDQSRAEGGHYWKVK